MEKFLKEAYGPEGRAVQVFLTVEEREEKSFAQCVGGGEWCQEGVAALIYFGEVAAVHLIYFGEVVYISVSCWCILQNIQRSAAPEARWT